MKHFVVNISWSDSFIYRLPEGAGFDAQTEIGKLVYALQEGANPYWKDADFSAEVVEVKFTEPLVPRKMPEARLKSVDIKIPDEDEDVSD